jgi:Fe2+ or Zn2+ uptake regulation protein
MAIIRFTRQRQAVLEVVQASREHPDAARVFEAVRETVPNISLGTVYRSLEALALEGHLIRIQQPGQATRYDARLDGHYHFICGSCGEVFDVMLELPDLNVVASKALTGFRMQKTKVEFHGVCQACQKN